MSMQLSFADFVRFLIAPEDVLRQRQQAFADPHVQNNLNHDHDGQRDGQNELQNEPGGIFEQRAQADHNNDGIPDGAGGQQGLANEAGDDAAAVNPREQLTGPRRRATHNMRLTGVNVSPIAPKSNRPHRSKFATKQSPTASPYSTRSKSRLTSSRIDQQIESYGLRRTSSNGGMQSELVNNPASRRNSHNRSYADTASSSRAYDIEVDVGRMNSWAARQSDESSTEGDPVESFLAHSHARPSSRTDDVVFGANVDSEDDCSEVSSSSREDDLDSVSDGSDGLGRSAELLRRHPQQQQQQQPQQQEPQQQVPRQEPQLGPQHPIEAVNHDHDHDLNGDDVVEEDDVFANDNDMFEQQAQEAHLALDRLLGLRGIGNLLRNSIWLMAFNFLFIAAFVALPYLIGFAAVHVLENMTVVAVAHQAAQRWIPVLCQVAVEVIAKSSSSDDAFQVLDLLLLTFGHFLIFCGIFALNEFVQLFAGTNHARSVANSLSSLVGVAKVGMLLFVRVFFLPIVLGKPTV